MMSIPEGNLEGKLVDADEGHELILQALAANGVECLFYCGGTDNFMFMESVKKFEALKRPHPKLYTCLQESAAVYAAYGYYMVTRKPQAVVLHVDCGTLNAGGAWVPGTEMPVSSSWPEGLPGRLKAKCREVATDPFIIPRKLAIRARSYDNT